MGSTRKKSKQVSCLSKKTQDWLPHGWLLLHKKRKNGLRAGEEYKCFIEQSSGCKFYSKPEVLRYLKTTMCSKGFSSESEQFMSSSMTMESTSEVMVENQNAIHLPPGWIRETKIRRTAKGIRRYPCYIEPVSGRVFHTKKKVLHFLQVNESSRQAMGPKNQQVTDRALDEDKSNASVRPTSPASGVLELNHPSSRREAFTGETSSFISVKQSHELSVTEENSDSGTSAPLIDGNSIEELDKSVSFVTGLITPEADKKRKDISFDEMEDTNEKTRNKSGTFKKKNFSICCRYSRRLAGFEPERETATSTEKASQDKTTSANLANGESPKFVAVQGIGRSFDTSVLLNGNLDGGIKKESPEIQEMFEEKTQNLKSGRTTKKESEEGLDFTTKEVCVKLLEEYSPNTVCDLAEAELHQKDKLLRRSTGNCDDTKSRANKSKNKKEDRLPCRSSKRLAGVEPELIGHSISCEKALEYISKKPRSDLTVNLVPQQLQVGIKMGRADVTSMKISKSTNEESFDKICRPFEVQESAFEKQQNPEAEIMDGEKAESHLSCPLGGSWSDPCLQIPIKTLTVELPVRVTADVNPNLNFGTSKSKNSMDEKNSKTANEMKTEKSKKIMEHNLPSESSNRLVGHEPELMANPIYGEKAPQHTTRKSDNDSAESSQQQDTGTDNDPSPLTDGKETTSDIQPSRLCEENCEAPSVAAKEQRQLQNVEVEHPQISFSVRDSWSDLCMDFAIKTLTGALSVEDIPNTLLISTNPEAKILPYITRLQNLGGRSINERNHMVFQPLKQQGHERERRFCIMPSNSTQEQGIEESFRQEANGEGRSVHGASKHLQTSTETEAMQEGPPEQINMGTEWQVVPQVQLENFVSPKINTHELHMPLSSPFLKSWSDPCLDFAIKTLTGAIPLEEPLSFRGHSLEIQTSAQSRATSVLQDFGFPGFFRPGVSPYYVPDKFVAVKQSPLSITPSVPPIVMSSSLGMQHLIDVGRYSVESEQKWSTDRRFSKSDTNGLSKFILPRRSVEEGLRSLWGEQRKGQDGRWCAGCGSMHMD